MAVIKESWQHAKPCAGGEAAVVLCATIAQRRPADPGKLVGKVGQVGEGRVGEGWNRAVVAQEGRSGLGREWV